MIGERLFALRTGRKWPMQLAADRLGIAKSTYAGYESGYREPSLALVRKMAALFDVSVDDLLSQTSGPEAASPPEADETDDPKLGLWFKELREAPAERREELRRIWETIKRREAGRTADSEQGDP